MVRLIESSDMNIDRMYEIKAYCDGEGECECTILEAKQFIKFLVSKYNGVLIDYNVEHGGRTDKFIIRADGIDYIIGIDIEGINPEGFIWTDKVR